MHLIVWRKKEGPLARPLRIELKRAYQVAVQDASAAIVTVEFACVPFVQSPVQPTNVAVAGATDSSETVAPSVNVYVQVVEDNVMRAVNSHASTVLEGWRPEVENMSVTGRNVKRLPEPLAGSGSNLVKFGEV